MNVSIPTHIAKPKPEMAGFGFTEPEETLCIVKLSTGSYGVSLAGFSGKRTAYKAFESLDAIKESFEFIHTSNPQLKS
jgi:hypothetical protein